MAGYEFGEELICLERVIIGTTTFPPGSVLPYVEMEVGPYVVEQLLNSQKVARKALIPPDMMPEICRDRTPKVIKNLSTGRVAVSWPEGVPLPEGVIDGRPGKPEMEEGLEEEEAQGGHFEKEESETEEEAPEEETQEVDEEEVEPPKNTKPKVELVPYDGGWYDVTQDGEIVNSKKLRKREAVRLKKKLER